MANVKIHVMPHPDGGWQVKREGSDKAVAKFKTKKEAMEKARSMSGRSDSHVVEHGEKGTVKNVSKSKKIDTDMTKVKVHVMPNPKGGWQVKREGSDKIIGNFDTKEEAMERGRELCGNSDSHLVEHSSRGTIKSVTKSKKVEKERVVVTKGKVIIREGSTAEIRNTKSGKTVLVIKEKRTAKKACTKKPAAAKKPAAKKAPAKKTEAKKEPAKKKVVVRKGSGAKVAKTSSGKTVVVRKK